MVISTPTAATAGSGTVPSLGLGQHPWPSASKYARRLVDPFDDEDERRPEPLAEYKDRVNGMRGEDESNNNTMIKLLAEQDNNSKEYDYYVDTATFGPAEEYWKYFTDEDLDIAVLSDEYADAVRSGRAAALAAAAETAAAEG